MHSRINARFVKLPQSAKVLFAENSQPPPVGPITAGHSPETSSSQPPKMVVRLAGVGYDQVRINSGGEPFTAMHHRHSWRRQGKFNMSRMNATENEVNRVPFKYIPDELEDIIHKFSPEPVIKGRDKALAFLRGQLEDPISGQKLPVGYDIRLFAITDAVEKREIEFFLNGKRASFSPRGLVRWALSHCQRYVRADERAPSSRSAARLRALC